MGKTILFKSVLTSMVFLMSSALPQAGAFAHPGGGGGFHGGGGGFHGGGGGFHGGRWGGYHDHGWRGSRWGGPGWGWGGGPGWGWAGPPGWGWGGPGWGWGGGPGWGWQTPFLVGSAVGVVAGGLAVSALPVADSSYYADQSYYATPPYYGDNSVPAGTTYAPPTYTQPQSDVVHCNPGRIFNSMTQSCEIR